MTTSIQTQLIIIRGNSGSGKTTLAKALQDRLGADALIVQQDEIRLRMLHVKDRPDNLAIDLIEQIAQYGNHRVKVVIVEGILDKSMYQAMLQRLMASFDQSWVYYFDIPLAETLKRHQQRAKAVQFTSADLKRWWLGDDRLQVVNEQIFTSADTLQSEIDQVLHQLN
ncbi:hypothetical protein MUDAN_BIHEEGNE_00316 [Lactiplantibacillus mudanjiangensis]|uniref:AAA family ATPase n=1 Tax=Lactiplantibacillus mudanjiangensis TaxID=1296538 RepID=UPI0010142A6E|nr:hypothetical protein MUDAN_BIHEEGNE_00316 [Lactiplantibacillus mudanjiangensis]